eukprot:comp18247_c0_seq1/m.32275 comp18247_c0_seq1/g.32275  ORF comp18247_c0_seq1/g.32275 comp18247_c0_seq1/m.32275 type:complete len:318 (-) comp18247_c0_seq1:122-1075(-)
MRGSRISSSASACASANAVLAPNAPRGGIVCKASPINVMRDEAHFGSAGAARSGTSTVALGSDSSTRVLKSGWNSAISASARSPSRPAGVDLNEAASPFAITAHMTNDSLGHGPTRRPSSRAISLGFSMNFLVVAKNSEPCGPSARRPEVRSRGPRDLRLRSSSSVSGVRPKTAQYPSSAGSSSGSSCLRTRELTPSAPTRTSQVSLEPSSNSTCTRGSLGCCAKRRKDLPKRTRLSRPASRPSRRVLRSTWPDMMPLVSSSLVSWPNSYVMLPLLSMSTKEAFPVPCEAERRMNSRCFSGRQARRAALPRSLSVRR